MDNYEILDKLNSIGRSIRQSQPFISQKGYVPETKDICKENGGPVDVCWSPSFHSCLRESLVPKKDKIENFDKIKYSFSTKNLVNYLSVHDNERLLHDIGKQDSDAFIRMKIASIILFTSVRIPLIWQGEELGDPGLSKRKHYSMPWDLFEKDFNANLFNIFKNLIELRQSTLALQEGPIDFFYEDENNRILCYSRGENLIVIINFDQKPKKNLVIPKIPQQGKWIDYFTNEQIHVDGVNNLTLDLLPFESKLYIKHN